MRVIVCGGRHYRDWAKVYQTLDHHSITELVQGGCPTGADAAAVQWAVHRKVKVQTFQADWEHEGLKAGPLRNQRMVDAGANLVVAFPGGRGTNDLVRRARKAGIPVMEVS